MPILYYNIKVDQNCDYAITFLWQSAGVAVNLTGYTAAMKVRATPSTSSASALSLTSGSGITLGGTAGTVAVAITKGQTVAIPARNYYYDLVLTSGSGTATKFLSGTFEVAFTIAQ